MDLGISRVPEFRKKKYAHFVKYYLQPVLMVLAVSIPMLMLDEISYQIFWFCLLLLLTCLEAVIPARPKWQETFNDKLMILGLVWIASTVGELVKSLLGMSLFTWLESIRDTYGLGIWPSDWPIIAQVLLVFISYELVNYWYHRGSHSWTWLWKASGHGTHHAFKSLTAINTMANHPFESLFLLLPRIVVGVLLGGEQVGIAAGSLFTVIVFMAHTNLDLNSKVIGWLFTTNRYHIHHHSMVREESNTNYGCACIMWDRVFGTFSDADTKEAGIGKTQPNFTELMLMPFEEPKSSEVAPSGAVVKASAN